MIGYRIYSFCSDEASKSKVLPADVVEVPCVFTIFFLRLRSIVGEEMLLFLE
jgi:hypothetical protein